MLFTNITIINSEFDAEGPLYVGVKEDRIAYIGKDKPRDSETYGDCYDGTGKLLMPGFVNAHAHTPMTLLRGYGEGLALQDWLFQKVFPFEDQLSGDAVYYGTLLGLAESARTGITSSSDMYYFCHDMARALADSQSKMNISRSLSTTEGYRFAEDPRWKDAQTVIKAWHGKENGRILADAALHSEYTTDEQTVRGLAEAAKEYGLRMQVHCSETKAEHEACKERHNGMTPVKYFEACGLLDVPTTLAHCVWCTEEDLEILHRKGAFVASNPVSNLKLSSGIADVKQMMTHGVPVAIGTDSVSSNNSLNFFEEVKIFALLQKVKANDPTFLTPKEALYAATRAGALSQGRTDTGLIAEGMKADLIVIDLDAENMTPCYDILYNVVYSADVRNLCLTMADGTVLYRDGMYYTIDIEKVKAEVKAATADILSRL